MYTTPIQNMFCSEKKVERQHRRKRFFCCQNISNYTTITIGAILYLAVSQTTTTIISDVSAFHQISIPTRCNSNRRNGIQKINNGQRRSVSSSSSHAALPSQNDNSKNVMNEDVVVPEKVCVTTEQTPITNQIYSQSSTKISTTINVDQDQAQQLLSENFNTKISTGIKAITNREDDGILTPDETVGLRRSTTSRPSSSAVINKKKIKGPIIEHGPKVLSYQTGFNVVLTHCTADFDSLASAVGLAKLWGNENGNAIPSSLKNKKDFDSASHVPTFVVLPRGAHPGVQRFLALHKHLFPIRSLKSLPEDLSKLNRLALVDAQRRERIGPAITLLDHAKRVTVVDHHVDQDSDIPANDYVVDKVGSVSTIIVERLIDAGISLTEAEATLLALGIHGDTGSLCFDSTTSRDVHALAWCLEEGASQTAIAEHVQSSMSAEQQSALTQALINTNTTVVHGVSVSTVLLSSDGFIQGLAAVTQDAMELSSSDVYLLALVYQAKSGSSRKRKGSMNKSEKAKENAEILTSKLLAQTDFDNRDNNQEIETEASVVSSSELSSSLIGPTSDETFRTKRLRAAFDRIDAKCTGFIEERDVSIAMSSSGIVLSDASTVADLLCAVDRDGDGKIDFNEFVDFATRAESKQQEENAKNGRKSTTMIIIGRVKAGVNMKAVKLNKLLEKFGGGGHPKAASATVRLDNESEAQGVLQNLVDELIETSLQSQPTVGDFMTSPALSVNINMNEKQVEDLFNRYDVRALPVVDDDNNVVGLVSYQLVAAAKQRLLNKEQKRFRKEQEAAAKGIQQQPFSESDAKLISDRKMGAAVKGWMLQHVQTVDASMTMAQVESVLLENDVGSLPVVAEGSKRLVGMVTRTDILRQHRYYDSLPYHNKGFADSIAARKPIIELRKKLKMFDFD